MSLTRNLVTMARHPAMIPAYARWMTRRGPGQPVVKLPGGGRAGGWHTFSEFWKRRGGIESHDRAVVGWCKSWLGKAMNASGSAVFDVGGNIGLFSLLLASAGFSRVIAFEPVPFNSLRFQDNLRLNPEQARRITLIPKATGGAPGQIEFCVNRTSPGTCKIAEASDVSADQEKVVVPITTVAEVCEEQDVKRITFMKIDVEGFELGVLQGARPLLDEKRVDFIFMEVIHEAWRNAGYSSDDVYDFLAGRGYRALRSSDDGSPVGEFTREQFARDDVGETRNVLWSAR